MKNVSEIIDSIRNAGYGINLSCWIKGEWLCKIWRGSPIDQSEVVVVVSTGKTIGEALENAKRRLKG